ncbi:MAG: hypothetical protein SPL14_00805, partial [Candidatus Onthomorpha sp.]|nr:hypothetical protein [Bacteroidales bacterium]MDD7485522.1 hypothetical protein [Bacteroidales bacterium]MDY5697953.1 hypothetical protein [Candidatus Onthomorpha sp.]
MHRTSEINLRRNQNAALTCQNSVLYFQFVKQGRINSRLLLYNLLFYCAFDRFNLENIASRGKR